MTTRLKQFLLTFVLGGLFAFSFIAIPTHEANAQVSYETIQDQGIIFAGICPAGSNPGDGDPCECRAYGNCDLDDVLQVFVNIASFILGISGSLTLLMFVFGGMVWLTSAGNENQIAKGKSILSGSVIGLLIIFGAYTAITLVVSVLRTGELTEEQTLEEATSSGNQSLPDGFSQ